MLCTIIEGSKRHRLEPWVYMRDEILRVSMNASPERLAELLPDRWAANHLEQVLSHLVEESRGEGTAAWRGNADLSLVREVWAPSRADSPAQTHARSSRRKPRTSASSS